MIRVRSALLLVILSAATSCTPAASTCRKFKEEGYVGFTQASCERCVRLHGKENPDAVIGCAVGLDAKNLLELGGAI